MRGRGTKEEAVIVNMVREDDGWTRVETVGSGHILDMFRR